MKKKYQMEDFTVDNLLSLLEIYRLEWEHRSDVLWRQVFTYFYAIVVVLFLPNVASFIGVQLPAIPTVLFPIMALILSFAFLYVSLGLSKRIDAAVRSYNKLIHLLPPELQTITVKSPEIKFGKFFSKRISVIVCYLLFFCLFVMAIVMIVVNVQK